jgi:hypothetical protein
MKNKFVLTPAVFGICTLALATVCIIARTLCSLLAFDTVSGYYQNGIATFLSLYLPLLCIAAVALFCFIPALRVSQNATSYPAILKYISVLPALSFALYLVISVIETLNMTEVSEALTVTHILGLIASLLGALFFAMIAFSGKPSGPLFLVSGIGTIVWAVVSLADSYFDISVQINSPLKVMHELAFLALMLFVLSEVRAVFDENRRQLQLFSVATAVLILGPCSISSIVFTITNTQSFSDTLLYSDITLLAVFIFAVARLVQLCFQRKAQTECECTESEDIQ